jgi:ribonuclease P protein component
MIAKKYRLTENEVKKVLKKKKPFFAYGVVANVVPNGLGHARVAMILSGAQTRWSVNRNTLRRRIYDLSSPYIVGLSVDIVYMFKKKTLLDSKDRTLMTEIEKDIPFLMRKIKQEKHKLSMPFEKRIWDFEKKPLPKISKKAP